MSRRTLLTLAAIAVMVVVLYTSTMTSQRAECTAVVTFRGATDSATASAATRDEAETQARNTACGTISSGMTDRIACTGTPPARLSCRTL